MSATPVTATTDTNTNFVVNISRPVITIATYSVSLSTVGFVPHKTDDQSQFPKFHAFKQSKANTCPAEAAITIDLSDLPTDNQGDFKFPSNYSLCQALKERAAIETHTFQDFVEAYEFAFERGSSTFEGSLTKDPNLHYHSAWTLDTLNIPSVALELGLLQVPIESFLEGKKLDSIEWRGTSVDTPNPERQRLCTSYITVKCKDNSECCFRRDDRGYYKEHISCIGQC